MRPIDYFDRGAVLAPERVFVTDGDHPYTYVEAARVTSAIARGNEWRE